MKKAYTFIMPVLVLIVVLSFFLPWVEVGSKAVGTFSKVLTGERQTLIISISGFKVPILANSPDARLMISVIKIFNPDIKDADKKSYLIWSIPLLAVIMFVAGYIFNKNRWLHLVFGIIGTAIFVVAFYKIKTTDLDKLVLNASIGSGLWLTLWAYLGIGILGLVIFGKSVLPKSK